MVKMTFFGQSKLLRFKVIKHNRGIHQTPELGGGNLQCFGGAGDAECRKENVMERKSKITILMLTLLISLCVVSSAFASDFCDGFEQGYKTGYKQAKGTSLDPLVPLCLQPLKVFGDPQSDFEHGYTIGFKRGMADGSK
jgi:hypothetical protein